jgi:hypothetical protein
MEKSYFTVGRVATNNRASCGVLYFAKSVSVARDAPRPQIDARPFRTSFLNSEGRLCGKVVEFKGVAGTLFRVLVLIANLGTLPMYYLSVS